MDYNDIGPGLQKYIRKSTYNGMTKDGKELYLKYAKKIIRKLEKPVDSEEEILIQKFADASLGKHVCNVRKANRSEQHREIAFVGMRYRGGHRFKSDDVVRLEKDDNNVHDPNAVKVLLKDGKEWKHVAYVAAVDAKWLRTIDFEKLALSHQHTYNASATYHIQLK